MELVVCVRLRAYPKYQTAAPITAKSTMSHTQLKPPPVLLVGEDVGAEVSASAGQLIRANEPARRVSCVLPMSPSVRAAPLPLPSHNVQGPELVRGSGQLG